MQSPLVTVYLKKRRPIQMHNTVSRNIDIKPSSASAVYKIPLRVTMYLFFFFSNKNLKYRFCNNDYRVYIHPWYSKTNNASKKKSLPSLPRLSKTSRVCEMEVYLKPEKPENSE